jgi:hypothetical protein
MADMNKASGKEVREALSALAPEGPQWKAIMAIMDAEVDSETLSAAHPDMNPDQRAHQCGRLSHAIDIRELLDSIMKELHRSGNTTS